MSMTQAQSNELRAALGLPAYDEKSAEVVVTSSDTAASLKTKIQATLQAEDDLAPWGRGRPVRMPTGRRTMGTASLSQNQSIIGAGVGQSVLEVDATGLPDGEHGFIDVPDDSYSKSGIRGQGRIQGVSFYGKNSGTGAVPAAKVVHGYRAAARPDGQGGFKASRAHFFDNAEFNGFTGNGVDIGEGNDQACSIRLRCEGNKGWGAKFVGSSDQKHFAMGLQGNEGGGMYAERCGTLVIKGFDIGNPNSGFVGEFSALFVDMQRLILEAGTISGRLAFKGRNDQGTGVRYDATGNMVRDLSIKVDENLAAMYTAAGLGYVYDSHILLEDVDEVIFDALKVMWNDVSPSAGQIAKRPQYIFKHTTVAGGGTAAKNRPGRAVLLNAAGLVHKYARTDDGEGLCAFSKHWSDQPRLVDFANFIPGRWEIVPSWMVNGADPEVRTHVALGSTIIKAKDPFGYLCATLNQATPGTLDDANTQVTLPTAAALGLGAAGSDHLWAMRIMPC